ncbi:hypothetical protein [Secundilactobacillus kimchicus]|uniref:hypothetical protein n=1 Tax=Secundilactobacillus kimchicus TaxID=528209 RepID=UPI0024A8BEA7|nr:hypothetical protein [Secundilactobacillus kimchicus]
MLLDDFNKDEIAETMRNGFSGWLNQGDASINKAIAEMVVRSFERFSDEIVAMVADEQLENASTGTLNLLAADWGINRIDDDDGFLRTMIRIAKMRRRSGITENDMIDLVAYVLQADKKDIHVISDREQLDGEPEAFKIKNLPNKYNDTRKTKLLINAIQNSVAPEVRLTEVQFQTLSTLAIYIGAVTQRHKVTCSVATILHSRTAMITHHVYIGAATQRWCQHFSTLLTFNLKGVDVNG